MPTANGLDALYSRVRFAAIRDVDMDTRYIICSGTLVRAWFCFCFCGCVADVSHLSIIAKDILYTVYTVCVCLACHPGSIMIGGVQPCGPNRTGARSRGRDVSESALCSSLSFSRRSAARIIRSSSSVLLKQAVFKHWHNPRSESSRNLPALLRRTLTWIDTAGGLRAPAFAIAFTFGRV